MLSVTIDYSGLGSSVEDVPDKLGWVEHLRGGRSLVEFEWSDPRPPSQAEMLWNFEAYVHGDSGGLTIRLEPDVVVLRPKD